MILKEDSLQTFQVAVNAGEAGPQAAFILDFWLGLRELDK